MITIFHGNNPSESRQAFFDLLNQSVDSAVLHLDAKSLDLNQINNFLNGGSLFPEKNILAVDNFFSLTKSTFDKLVKIFNSSPAQIILWQDKALTVAQTKIFPQAKYFSFKSDNQIFACLNAIKPKNLSAFNRLYGQIISQNLFDLFLYLLKANFRRQLQTYSKYDKNLIEKIYLQTIELEFQYKSGQLSLPKDIALQRVLLPLLK
jgi:hypothetical protein